MVGFTIKKVILKENNSEPAYNLTRSWSGKDSVDLDQPAPAGDSLKRFCTTFFKSQAICHVTFTRSLLTNISEFGIP